MGDEEVRIATYYLLLQQAPDASGILKEGFSRLLDVIKVAHVVDANFSYEGPSPVLKGIQVVILSPSDEAKTVYGALHGLQIHNRSHWRYSSYPKLWNGATSSSERYTVADAAEIICRKTWNQCVLAELDAQDMLSLDFSKIFKYKFVHLGGEGSGYKLKQHRLYGTTAYEYFVLRAQKIAYIPHGYENYQLARGGVAQQAHLQLDCRLARCYISSLLLLVYLLHKREAMDRYDNIAKNPSQAVSQVGAFQMLIESERSGFWSINRRHVELPPEEPGFK
ncbi:hypothetical protein HAX54_008504 [Datura stramonium]|uniref:Uncharacterized protein n=1 Tax=Datura stramonium TaxID=4076 RepID=A0ABS8TEA0_DATST|nr:hypothetical protein [Datura stramonium]